MAEQAPAALWDTFTGFIPQEIRLLEFGVWHITLLVSRVGAKKRQRPPSPDGRAHEGPRLPPPQEKRENTAAAGGKDSPSLPADLWHGLFLRGCLLEEVTSRQNRKL